jgi:hypothetical protein
LPRAAPALRGRAAATLAGNRTERRRGLAASRPATGEPVLDRLEVSDVDEAMGQVTGGPPPWLALVASLIRPDVS